MDVQTDMTAEMQNVSERKYREAQAWVDESRQAMDQADAAFRADPNEDTGWALSVAQANWRRDIEIRMQRAEQMTDDEYDQTMKAMRGVQ